MSTSRALTNAVSNMLGAFEGIKTEIREGRDGTGKRVLVMTDSIQIDRSLCQEKTLFEPLSDGGAVAHRYNNRKRRFEVITIKLL